MTAPVKPGDVLAEKYRVERVLGQGGMGVVVAAEDTTLGRPVAVKFLLPDARCDPMTTERFLREARAAVKIKSEHVARVIEVGKLDDGSPYIVMEFLEGRDLAEVVKSGALAVDDAVEYVLQACEALAEAHTAGIIHRDLKPANLFLAERADGSPVIKVLDFGISKVIESGKVDGGLTRTSAMMGSPFYMSPEQTKSAKDVDARTDLWALGVILYELVTGSPPFHGENMGELVAAILTEAPKPLGEAKSGLPGGLETVVMRCLEKDPDARYANVGELAQALIAFAPERARLSGERAVRVAAGASQSQTQPLGSSSFVTAPTEPGVARSDAESAGRTATSWAETNGETAGTAAPQPPRTRAPWVLLGGVAAALTGGGIYLASTGPTPPAAGSADAEPGAAPSSAAASGVSAPTSPATVASPRVTPTEAGASKPAPSSAPTRPQRPAFRAPPAKKAGPSAPPQEPSSSSPLDMDLQ